MSTNNSELTPEVKAIEGGKVVFAPDVIATIAGLAAADVKGVAGMSGGVVEGFTEKFGRKNLTKGVKVEVGAEETAIDVSVIIQYGFRIQDVCVEIQEAVKKAIETMTGLRVVEVNVFVQGISFDAPETKRVDRADKAEKTEKAEKEIEAPRVK